MRCHKFPEGMNLGTTNTPKQFRVYQRNLPKNLLKYSRIHSSMLKVEKTHIFDYVEVEVILPPFKGQAYHTMNADTMTSGDGQSIVGVSIYNDVFCKHDESYIEVGQRLVVLDPFFRFASDNSCVIKVTKLENLILLGEGQTFEQLIDLAIQDLSSASLKDFGNQVFALK